MGRSMNAVTVTVQDYAPDPHGHQLFSALARWANPNVQGRHITQSSGTWYGWTQAQQAFRGAAALGAGRPLTAPASTINDQQSTTDATVADIFRSRYARGVRG